MRVYDALTMEWSLLGAPGSASVDDDWWGVVCETPSGRLYRVSRDYGLANGALGLRQFGWNAAGQTDWLTFGHQPASEGQAHYIDIESDAWNRILVAYQDGRPGDATGADKGITILRIDGVTSRSQPLGKAGFSRRLAKDSRTQHCNVEVAHNGTVWAAWHESADALRGAVVASYDESLDRWTVAGSAVNGRPGSGQHVSLAIDPTGAPVVAYRVFGPPRFRVMRYDRQAQAWLQLGHDIGTAQLAGGGYPGFSREAGYRERTPFAVGRNGGTYLGFLSPDPATPAPHTERLIVWSFDGQTWSPVGPTGFLPGSDQQDYATIDVTSRGGFDVPVVLVRSRPLTPRESLVGFTFR